LRPILKSVFAATFERSPSRRQEKDNLHTLGGRLLEISSELLQLVDPLEKALTDFSKHTDVNELIDAVQRVLRAFAEVLVIAVVQPLLESQGFLTRLKAIAATKALRFHGYRNISVRMLTGERLSLRTPYFIKARPKRRRRGKRRKSSGHLALQYLGFIDRVSIRLASVAAQSALLCPSFEIARQTLQHHGIELGVKTIQRICRAVGEKAMGHREAIALGTDECADGRVVLVCVDGGRIRERKTKRGRRPKGRKRQGYHTDWREPNQIVIQCFNADGSKSEDCLPIYDATMGDIDQAFELIEAYLRQLDITKAEHVVFCADGARSYWKRFGPLARKLKLTGHFEVIDYTHAKQNLLQIAEELPKKMVPAKKAQITQQWIDLLWSGDLHEIYKQMTELITYKRKRKKALTGFKSYFLDNYHRMQYAGFRYFNATTGSGCVQSAIRRVINLRLKSPGIFWKRQSAEVMLFLRSTLLCGRWKIMLKNLLADGRGQFQCCN
jgi:hypothetical protein